MKRLMMVMAVLVVGGMAVHTVSRSYAKWLVASGHDIQSQCFGSVKDGRLAYGVWLPYWGDNYRAYHWSGWLLGRANAHTSIKAVMQASYAELAETKPELRFTYGEISWPWGGQLWPHITHRNGEAVDFFVPVRRRSNGRSVFFPANLFNKLGYDFDFDSKGKTERYVIDYDAMAAHLLALGKAAKRAGTPIRRVIFDPKLQPLLLKTKSGRALSKLYHFSKRRSWVRHDDHYHVEFELPCG